MYPFKQWFYRVWFYIPRKIEDYNRSECENYTPDWMCGEGTKVKPFLGYVLITEESGIMSLAWWKHLKKYEVSSDALKIQADIDSNLDN